LAQNKLNMFKKILILVCIIQFVIISIGPFFYSQVYSSDMKSRSAEIDISLEDGRKWKACNVTVIDKDLNRMVTAHRFVISKENKCPEFPQDLLITKEEYIKELQNNKGWGIFDRDYIYPEMIPPDIKQANQSSSNSSK
jgi:hypothetical protein